MKYVKENNLCQQNCLTVDSMFLFRMPQRYSGPWVLEIKFQNINLLSSCFVIVDQYLFIDWDWN